MNEIVVSKLPHGLSGPGCPCGLSGAGLGDSGWDHFFELQVKSVKIVGRHPASGLPPAGVGMSIDVQVQTARNPGYFLRYPLSTISCPNAIVVARTASETNPTILGHVLVNTNTLQNCTGKARIMFPGTYRPVGGDWIVLEVYEDTVTDFENTPPVYASQPIQIGASYQEGVKTGVYSKPASSGLLSALTPSLKNITKVLAVGTLAYGTWKFAPLVKELASNHIKGKAPHV